ncbi:MAG: hypothetical protein K0Q90_2366 [Paenibacillaceae bacterium]|nr:hypothetical protein [Paenibacillaceae bacterium]
MQEAHPVNSRTVREWLYAGPFDREVSELYYDNYTVPAEPYQELADEAAARLEGMDPAEGKTVELFGQNLQWKLARHSPSEHKMTWARFGVHARMLVTYAYTRLSAPKDGVYPFLMALTGSVLIRVNGQEIFSHIRLGRTDGEFRLELPLREGENEVLLLLYNVHLHCINSFTLRTAEEIQPRLPLLLEEETRRQLEEELADFHIRNPVVQDRQPVTLHWSKPVESGGEFIIGIHRMFRGVQAETLLEQKVPLGASPAVRSLELLSAGTLPIAEECSLTVDYEADSGERVSGIALPVKRIGGLDSIPPGADYRERGRHLLEQMTGMKTVARTAVYAELAKMELDRWEQVDAARIGQTLDYINARFDCADFSLHGVLRMYALHGKSGRLDQELLQRMKACILGFKYGTEEKGRSMMFTRSENHEMLFYSAEYAAGLLFPEEIFQASGQNGLFHALRGRLNAERWIREKGTYGFMEWHSNTYFEENILALLTVTDFGAETAYVRILARQLLDLMVAILATHTSRGIMGTTHGRAYEESVIYPETEPIGAINTLLFGQPERPVSKLSMGCIALASSRYAPDWEWEEVAASREPLYTKSCMGLFPHRNMEGVNCAVYRTPDYMVSGMADSLKGLPGEQVHAGQVLLDGSVPVFVTCFDNKSPMTRPSYWGGQYRTPRMFAHRQVLAYIYRLEEGPGYTHAYFPFGRMDETAEAGGWLFGRKGDAYVAVYSRMPYTVTRHGEEKDRELLCMEKSNIWLLEAGSRQERGSFGQFMEAIAAARISGTEGGGLGYESPSIGTVFLDYDSGCLLNGEAFPGPGGYPLIDSPYACAEYGSGLAELRLGGRVKKLNFRI